MASGPEMLMNALLKTSGINPAEITAHIQAQIQQGVSAMQSADERLALIYNHCIFTNARLSRIEADIQRIMDALHIHPETDVSEPSVQLLLLEAE